MNLNDMQSGDEHEFTNPDNGAKMRVRYEAEQAMGDNGRPAKGYTVGYYHVHGPGEDEHESFRHTPHGPTLELAKPYAATQAARHITRKMAASSRDVHPRNGRLGM